MLQLFAQIVHFLTSIEISIRDRRIPSEVQWIPATLFLGSSRQREIFVIMYHLTGIDDPGAIHATTFNVHCMLSPAQITAKSHLRIGVKTDTKQLIRCMTDTGSRLLQLSNWEQFPRL